MIKAAWPRLGTRRGATPESTTAVRRDARLLRMLVSEIELHFSDKWVCHQSGERVLENSSACFLGRLGGVRLLRSVTILFHRVIPRICG